MAAHGFRTVAAILVAGGSGSRLGADVPKAFCRIGARTMLERSLEPFAGHPAGIDVVVVAPAAHVTTARRLTDAPVVAGGSTRQASVSAGLSALATASSTEPDFVLVHDVARPFVPLEVIDAVIAALHAGADAVVPVVPVHDTIRRVDGLGVFVEVVDRSVLVAVQTPQGFRTSALVAAHASGHSLSVTDDAALIEAAGGRVVSVPGSDASFKITRPWDLAVAEALVAADG